MRPMPFQPPCSFSVRDHLFRAEGTHVQPERGGAGAAIEHEGDGALAGIGDAIPYIGDREDGGGGLVFRVAQVDFAGDCLVLDGLAIEAERMV